jgi:hypothetical protein
VTGRHDASQPQGSRGDSRAFTAYGLIVGKRRHPGDGAESGRLRTFTKARPVCSIAAPLLIVTRSLDDGSAIERLFGTESDATLLGVFARSNPQADTVVDLRDAPASRAPAVSLDRVVGDRQHTEDIGALIADAINSVEASTVAISLGVLDADDVEASDAALLARRLARPRIRWICYSVGDPDIDVGRIARRRMSLFARGVRLEPVVVAELPLGSSARFWEIRAPHRY